jgi:CubicO group peptidase (beta-lactamase class C family)
MSYKEFIKKNLFEPAGMKNTEVFSLLDTTIIENSVKGHYANKRHVQYNYLNGVVGDKGLYSTVTDLYKWDKALFSGKIIKKETLEFGLQPTSEIKRNGQSYGYGWRLRFLEDSTKIVFHGGWWQGFKSCYMHIPKDETLIVVLSNVANRGFNFGLLLDAYTMITPGFKNPYSNRISSRDSLSF